MKLFSIALAGIALALAALRALPPPAPVQFVDVAKAAGITFRHENAAAPQKYMIETMGSGCGWIDYNRDGLPDLYLVNGAATSAFKPLKPLRPRSTGITEMAASRT